MSPIVPRHIAEEVLRQIGVDADAADWDRLPQADKTALIARWVESEEIGGVLRPLLGGDAEVRLWLKDVALRRRSWRRQPEAALVAAQTIGEGAKVVSAGKKPSHALVERDGATHYVCWGPYANVRNLFWAALNALEDGVVSAQVAVIERGTVTTPDRRARVESLASRAGIVVRWLNL